MVRFASSRLAAEQEDMAHTPQGTAQADKRTAAFEDIFGRPLTNAAPSRSSYASQSTPHRTQGSMPDPNPANAHASFTANPRWNPPAANTSGASRTSSNAPIHPSNAKAWEPHRVYSQPVQQPVPWTQEQAQVRQTSHLTPFHSQRANVRVTSTASEVPASLNAGRNSSASSPKASAPASFTRRSHPISVNSMPYAVSTPNVAALQAEAAPHTHVANKDAYRRLSSKLDALSIQDTPPMIPSSVVAPTGSFMDSHFWNDANGKIPSRPGSETTHEVSSASTATSSTQPTSYAMDSSSATSLASRPLNRVGSDSHRKHSECSASLAPTTEFGRDCNGSMHVNDLATLPIRQAGSSGWDSQEKPHASDAHARSEAYQVIADTGASQSMSPSLGNAKGFDTSSLLSHKSSHTSIRPSRPVASQRGSAESSRRPLRSDTAFHPALLSEVARAFVKSIVTCDLNKNGLTYSHAFDGRQAVDNLAAIVRTTDRNLALLLGRALDAQKLFHDVNYDHRLRDSVHEVYQFQWHHGQYGHEFDEDGTETPKDDSRELSSRSSIRSTSSLRDLSSGLVAGLTPLSKRLQDSDHLESKRSSTEENDARWNEDRDAGASEKLLSHLPSGVFTLLTPCYSPTCTPSQPCYSIACPRHLESQTAISTQLLSKLDTSVNQESLVDITSQLWAESVPKEIYKSVPERERKRQEVIFEVIATERRFVQDLEYVRDHWILPLSTQHIIDRTKRADFVHTVFQNLEEILGVNQRVSEMLTRRQTQRAVVECIGDIYLDVVDDFQPYVTYGARQMYARHELEAEKANNAVFALFVTETERKAASRKLELNGYLTKPTTRLARLPLLFEQVLKYTEEENPDKVLLPIAIQKIKALLSRVNQETGRNENRMQISQLSDRLVFRAGETVNLRLKDPHRELVFRGSLKKRSGSQSDNADIQVYLFDHALLMVKHKIVHKTDMEKVYRKPIPLELLQITVYEDVPTGKGNATRTKAINSRSTLGKRTNNGPPVSQPITKQDAKTGYAITFTYLGKKGYSLTLWASTYVSRSKWFEHIEARQEMMRHRSQVFDTLPVSQMPDVAANRITCAVPFDFGRQVFYGKNDGVYIAELRMDADWPVKVLPLLGVTQVDVLEDYQVLIVLAEQSVYTFTLDALDSADPVNSLKRGRRISSHTTFFRAGVCLGRTLVCVVKSGPVSSTIKTLEPIERDLRQKKQPTFRKLLQGGQDTLGVFKEFYIPTESSSIHFLKSKLCIGTTKGFEIVDLETLDTQGLLDPADTSLEFVHRRENLKPMAVYRIEGEFLLCYNEFAFYVNKNGWRSKGNWLIQWEGNPTSFAFHHPYILAFEPNFVEVRHVDTGVLHQVITGQNLHCLFADAVNFSYGVSRNPHAARSHGKVMFPGRKAMSSFAAPSSIASPAMEHGMNPTASPPGNYQSRTGSPTSAVFFPGSVPHPNSVPRVSLGSTTSVGVQSPPSGTCSPRLTNPAMDFVAASRSQILFVGDSSVYSVRLHTSHS
ncbi:RHO1 GDP-GTP exchange protein 2 [Malassezia yamatoensis]|uniref:RHO1 GDP-GTP exchange protein 2 n=1 Tax=Malassezia yamatoensis TaxID=253288 RepID=A0AAJ6CJX6_9BASI|nr:RHO1 GDP-GTP exchange protein 2 [Malassezia yamatoensis]